MPKHSEECFGLWSRRQLIFPGGRPPSIFSEDELNFCVRHGNRCDLISMITDYRLRTITSKLNNEGFKD